LFFALRDDTPLKIVSTFDALQKKCGREDDRPWSYYANRRSRRLERLNRTVLANSDERTAIAAGLEFKRLIRGVLCDERSLELWTESFLKVCSYCTGFPRAVVDPPIQVSDSIKKIFVSGMGWSGSGALFDYFSEYGNVIALKSEFRFIEGPHGIEGLFDKRDDGDGFRIAFLRFFAHALLGCGAYEDYEDFKLCLRARERIRSRVGGIYTERINRCCRILADLGSEAPRDDRFFRTLLDALVFSYGARHENISGSTVLLNNAVHIQRISALRIVGDATVFCVFRDPRSNYVARKREQPEFILTPEEYIDEYRQRRMGFQRDLERLADASVNLHVVRFEEFVSSESYRRSLAIAAGLNPDTHRARTIFREEDSLPNTVLHRSYPNQQEIAKIERELSEYCIDL
jgi:hypothetical protein